VIRLALRVRPQDAEVVLAELLDLASAGVEESVLPDGNVEFAVYGAPGELPELPDLRAAAGDSLVEVSTSQIADDWHDRWKSFHRPILIEAPAGSGLTDLHVRPPWLDPLGRGDVSEIVIDPGRAFGTGAHSTTKLCLRLLLELAAEPASERGPVLDIGTGSGVLAIAAAKLGLEPVAGFDNDRVSVSAANSNASANGVAATFSELDLRGDPLPPMAGAIVLGNLLRPLLLELCAKMDSAPEHLLISGLLAQEAAEVSGAFSERHGMQERARLVDGEWAAAWLERRPR